MEWNIKEIKRSFSGRLIGGPYMKRIICKTMQCLPSETIKYATANIWFISSPDDAWAFTFRGSDIRDQYLIIISEELLKQDSDQIRYSILHEIGHVLLRHRNSMGRRQTPIEIAQQEEEADQFARKYLFNQT